MTREIECSRDRDLGTDAWMQWKTESVEDEEEAVNLGLSV